MDTYTQAFQYIQNGWSIVPVQPKSKMPLISWAEFQTRKPTDQELQTWFLNTENNVAVVTGRASGIVVIDCEKDCNKTGIEFPETLSADSGGGGKHYFFKYPADVEVKTRQRIKEKMDLLADVALCTISPSIHPSGTAYKWNLTSKGWFLAELPKWVLEESEKISAAEKDWEKIMAGSPDGYRGTDAASVIGKLLTHFPEKDWNGAAWNLFLSWGKSCDPPLEFQRLKTTYESIAKRELAKREKKPKKGGHAFTRIAQAEAFIEENPIYYSREGLFWAWNPERFCYELTDETNLLNSIRSAMPVDTIDSKVKTEIITALKQVGRLQAPEIKPKGWIQFLDVLVNPKTLEQIPATPEYFLTNPIPHKLGTNEDTPQLEKLMREWVIKDGAQDESYVKSLYEFMAYSLTDDKFMQRIIALVGGGSNGKGTYLSVIRQLAGSDNCVSVNLKNLSMNTFATSGIYKKLIAFCGEVNYSDLKNTNTLKLLTGEDLIRYEFKGKTPFTAENMTTVLIASNALPTTPDRSCGFYRRWVIVDFPNIFPVKSDVISTISEVEYENLCFRCVNVLKGLYKTHQFTNEGNYEEREQKYEERSNPLPTFIQDECEEIVGAVTRLQEFTTKFNDWLKDKRLKMMTIRQVGQALRSEGYTVGKRRMEDDSFVGVLGLEFKGSTLTGTNDDDEEDTETNENI